MSDKKPATITFRPDKETDEMIDKLVEYFQQESVSKVTRSDILRKGIKDMYTSLFADKENAK